MCSLDVVKLRGHIKLESDRQGSYLAGISKPCASNSTANAAYFSSWHSDIIVIAIKPLNAQSSTTSKPHSQTHSEERLDRTLSSPAHFQPPYSVS